MPAILKHMKRSLFQMLIRISAQPITRQLYRGTLGRAPQSHELSAGVEAIRKSGKILPVVKSLMKSREFRMAFSSKKMLKPVQSAKGELARLQNQTPSEITAPSRKARMIIVSGNCQSVGVAGVLQQCFAEDTVIPVMFMPSSDEATMADFIAKLEQADIWVSQWEPEWVTKLHDGFKKRLGVHFLRMPSIVFHAFHPDLCYARNAESGVLTNHHYNSAIAAWAYNQGMETRDTARLFNREVYGRLGYFQHWDRETQALRQAFNDCGLDFARYFLATKRTGVFMHSVNHPMLHAVDALAKSVAVKLGAPDSVFEWDFKDNDTLIDTIWPLYPEIADHYSLTGGSYHWKLRGLWIRGLENYLDWVFQEYRSQQIPKKSLEIMNRDCDFLNQVLSPYVGIFR
jgi:hypothetical protein